MCKYTRDNIYSKMLKTVVIRFDFKGLTDTKSFVNRLKASDQFKSSFEKMQIIPKRKMQVTFSPVHIQEGLLPLTTSQRSTVFRFYDCKLGSDARLDIESQSITLVVDCSKKYGGSKAFTHFMSFALKELRNFDKFVEMKRIGIRKIDIQILGPEESIGNYFNEKFIVAQCWENNEYQPKAVLTEMFDVDGISYNVVQRVDNTQNCKIRVIYDIDSFIQDDKIHEVLNSDRVEEFLYHDMQDRMFNMFVSVASQEYLEKSKNLKTEQNG